MPAIRLSSSLSCGRSSALSNSNLRCSPLRFMTRPRAVRRVSPTCPSASSSRPTSASARLRMAPPRPGGLGRFLGAGGFLARGVRLLAARRPSPPRRPAAAPRPSAPRFRPRSPDRSLAPRAPPRPPSSRTGRPPRAPPQPSAAPPGRPGRPPIRAAREDRPAAPRWPGWPVAAALGLLPSEGEASSSSP